MGLTLGTVFGRRRREEGSMDEKQRERNRHSERSAGIFERVSDEHDLRVNNGFAPLPPPSPPGNVMSNGYCRLPLHESLSNFPTQIPAEAYHWLFVENQSIEQELYDMRQQLSEKANQYESLRRQHFEMKQSFRKELDARKVQLSNYEQEINPLRAQIEALEKLHAQNTIADSSSYQDSGATPPLLQTAVDAVKDAVRICASDFFSSLRKHTDIIYALLHVNPTEQKSSSLFKAALQAFLSGVFFKGFENLYFSLKDNNIPRFQIPSECKRELFVAYKRCRDREAPQLVNEDKDFKVFVHAKAHEMKQEIRTRLLAIHANRAHNGEMADAESVWKHMDESKFLRLAKSVWALHKLAMAFEPSAEIFHVGQGSLFYDKHMENMVYGETDTEECDGELVIPNSEKQVELMCVPGFRVRQTVIKCQVVCLPYLQQDDGCTPATDSSTPMIIEDELP